MDQKLRIKVDKGSDNYGIARFRKIPIREKILRLLFGEKNVISIVIPGRCVSEVEIEGGKSHG